MKEKRKYESTSVRPFNNREIREAHRRRNEIEILIAIITKYIRMIDACVRSHARGESKPLRLKARDPLVGVRNGYTPGVSPRFGSPLRSPSTRSTVHNLRTEPRYVAASRFSPRHFSRYSITDLYLYSLSLSSSRFPNEIVKSFSLFLLPFLWNENLGLSNPFDDSSFHVDYIIYR